MSGFVAVNCVLLLMTVLYTSAGPRSAPVSQVRGPGLDTQPGHILSFLLPLIQEGQLSVTGESMCMKYWWKKCG